MSYNSFTDSDKATLLSNPGVFYYRPFVGNNDSPTVPEWTPALFANGAKFAKSVTVADVQFDDVGTVQSEVSDETAAISVSTARVLDLEFIADVSGGLMAYTDVVVPGSAVPAKVDTVISGNWHYSQPIILEGQNASGLAQTIASVVGTTDGTIDPNTEYDVVQLPEVGWGIVVHHTGAVTTENQTITITYAYTPAASTTKVLKTGGVKVITPLDVKFVTIDSLGKAVEFRFYKCFANGSYGHGFAPENKADPVLADVSFTAKKDSTRSAGDQLYTVTRAV